MRLAQGSDGHLAFTFHAHDFFADRLTDEGMDDASFAQFAFDLVRFLCGNSQHIARLVLAIEERDRFDRRAGHADIDAGTLGSYDFRDAYVRDLSSIIDVDAIRKAGVRIGADPLGGASVEYWALIAEVHDLDLTVVNPEVDPTWRFMTLDWDEKIRMDPSSPSAMASLVAK